MATIDAKAIGGKISTAIGKSLTIRRAEGGYIAQHGPNDMYVLKDMPAVKDHLEKHLGDDQNKSHMEIEPVPQATPPKPQYQLPVDNPEKKPLTKT